jgi:hypothetical protein
MKVWTSFRTATGDTRYARRMWLVCVALPCLAIAAVAVVASVAGAHTKVAHVASVPASQSPRVCFPAAKWGPAPKRLAPCVRIRRVYEDGSFEYAVSDRDGTVRYSAGVGAKDR